MQRTDLHRPDLLSLRQANNPQSIEPIDPAREALVRLADVPDLPWLPRGRNGRPLHRNTIFLWWHRGIRGVRLATIKIGGTRCTSVRALVAFFHQSSGTGANPSPIHSPSQGHRIEQAAERAHRILSGRAS